MGDRDYSVSRDFSKQRLFAQTGNLTQIRDFNIKRDHLHKKLPLLYKEFYKVKKKYNLKNLDDECCSIIGKLVDEEYFKNKIINMKLICEILDISINTLKHLPKLRLLIIDIEIKYNGRAFYQKIIEK